MADKNYMLCIFMENAKVLFSVKFVLMVRMEKFNLDHILL